MATLTATSEFSLVILKIYSCVCEFCKTTTPLFDASTCESIHSTFTEYLATRAESLALVE